jgi:hypothetical protein
MPRNSRHSRQCLRRIRCFKIDHVCFRFAHWITTPVVADKSREADVMRSLGARGDRVVPTRIGNPRAAPGGSRGGLREMLSEIELRRRDTEIFVSVQSILILSLAPAYRIAICINNLAAEIAFDSDVAIAAEGNPIGSIIRRSGERGEEDDRMPIGGMQPRDAGAQPRTIIGIAGPEAAGDFIDRNPGRLNACNGVVGLDVCFDLIGGLRAIIRAVQARKIVVIRTEEITGTVSVPIMSMCPLVRTKFNSLN